ncbi:CPBP family intramembrane glutamic endopeptidase [Bacteroidota bacterium]
MKYSKKANKSIIAFFLLTFLLSIPFYILNVLASINIVGEPEMGGLYIALFTLTPITSASILTFRRHGISGLKKLLSRTFDFRRITKKRWYIIIILISPLIFLLSLLGIVLSKSQIPDPLTPLVMLPAVFLFFFLLAAGEEVGWMGYAFEPMQERYKALLAALMLGIIWALWHLPFFIFMMPDLVDLTAQLLILIGIRLVAVWIFNNTGKNVFAVILFHAVDNTALVTFPEIKAVTPLGSLLVCGFVILTAIIIIMLWDAGTLTQYRFGRQDSALPKENAT